MRIAESSAKLRVVELQQRVAFVWKIGWLGPSGLEGGRRPNGLENRAS